LDTVGPEELSPREVEVLAAIGRRLTNAEIASELFISVRTVESHVASLRRKLGVDSRSRLIAIARSRRGTAIQLPQNSFVGRDDEVADLRALLASVRWVTVVGPAGCGKTRLALEVAVTSVLVPVVAEMEHATAGSVINSVAQAIGLATDSSADLLAACGVALATEPYLLVLDDCDRVTDAVAEMVGELMARARSLTVLATSRSPLGGTDETVCALEPLPVADDESAAAVRLFLDRAAAAAPAVRFSDADIGSVARICRQLDGLPLAIELAAARVRHVPIAELAVRLTDGLHLLDRPGPPSRHRTLEAAFDWTWELLDDDERSVLSPLAALPRTFDLDLAEAITAPGAASVVLRLLDRSLVSPTVGVSHPRRYRLLESLRSFVLARAEPSVVHGARLAHAEHQAAQAAELAQRIRVDDSRTLVDETRRIAPEVAAAIDWAGTEQEQATLAVSLTGSLARLVEHSGPDIDSLAAIDRAARTPAIRAAATATDLFEIGRALCYGDLELLDDFAALAIDIATDDRSRLAAHHLAGWADTYGDRATSAMTHLDAAERLAVECDDVWQLASIRQAKGVVLRRQRDDLAGAITMLESAAETYALAGDAMHVNNCLYMMASAAADSGDRLDEAITWIEHCETHARATGNHHELAHATLTRVALDPGPDDEALLRTAGDVFQASGDLRCLTRSYLLRARQRPPHEQIPLLHEALAVATDANDHTHQATALEHLITAHWVTGARRQAATTLGVLVNLLGHDAAADRCPPSMIDELPQWRIAIAEGQARGHTTPDEQPQPDP
jgi:predicted ATPase/DNA-binding CsgD family transcriptional regulator